jgi:hypothetical protein
MKKWNRSPRQDLDAKASQEQQNLRSDPERIAVLEKAEKLRTAANVYNYLFSSELKPPQ